MTNKTKYTIIGVAILILSIGGYIWYIKHQNQKNKECCEQKKARENTLVIENYKLDSLLKIKDTVFIPIIEKSKVLKNKSNEIKSMVIINKPDSLFNSLTKLSNYTKQGRK